jgi:hypothetical protein
VQKFGSESEPLDLIGLSSNHNVPHAGTGHVGCPAAFEESAWSAGIGERRLVALSRGGPEKSARRAVAAKMGRLPNADNIHIFLHMIWTESQAFHDVWHCLDESAFAS